MKRTLLSAAIAATLVAGSAQAVVFDLYNDINGYSGLGDELANALVAPGSGIYIVPDSAEYVGNFDGLTFPIGDGEMFIGDGEMSPSDGDFIIDPPPNEGGDLPPMPDSYGSAAFFYDLDLGDGITLPNGVLLTSGYADPPTSNTDSGFTGFASGMGDAGLDTLLSAAGFMDTTWDSTVLSFDFIVDPGINAISLDFIFGSEEYPEFADTFPDIAAIFVDGVNYAGFADGSLLSVRTSSITEGNFIDNSDGFYPIEYDGLTVPLTAVGLLDPDTVVHNIKIAISDTNDPVLDSGIFVANMTGLSLTGTSPDDPIMPIEGDDPSDGFDFIIDVGDAGVGIDPTQPIFIDPIVAVGYVYETTGPNFATVLLPDLPFGDDLYNVYGWNGSSFDFLGIAIAGSTFNLLDYDPAGYATFMIDGIELGNMLDPADPYAFVTGLTFVGGGNGFGLKMTPITQNYNPVSAPAVPALLLLGLSGLAWARRRRA